MSLQFDGEFQPLQPEDILEMADTICRGDIVWFDRIGPQSVLMRIVPDGELENFSHPVWRIDRGKEPGTTILTPCEVRSGDPLRAL